MDGRGGYDLPDWRKVFQSAQLCGLRGPLQAAKEAFFAALDDVTLSDVTQDKSGVAMLLGQIDAEVRAGVP